MCNGLWQNKIVRVCKNSGPVLSRLWTNVHEILQQRRRPFVVSTPLLDCLCHVSFSRYSPLTVEIVENPNKCKSFLAPNFFPEGRLQLFYNRLLARPASTVWQSVVEFRLLISVCKAWQWSEMHILRRVGENPLPIWSRLWTKVHAVFRRCNRPLVVCNALARLSISCFIPKT